MEKHCYVHVHQSGWSWTLSDIMVSSWRIISRKSEKLKTVLRHSRTRGFYCRGKHTHWKQEVAPDFASCSSSGRCWGAHRAFSAVLLSWGSSTRIVVAEDNRNVLVSGLAPSRLAEMYVFECLIYCHQSSPCWRSPSLNTHVCHLNHEKGMADIQLVDSRRGTQNPGHR